MLISQDTTGPIHTWFVAFERKFSLPHFGTILGVGKYHKTSTSKSLFLDFIASFVPG
jgi:hypothetical protein